MILRSAPSRGLESMKLLSKLTSTCTILWRVWKWKFSAALYLGEPECMWLQLKNVLAVFSIFEFAAIALLLLVTTPCRSKHYESARFCCNLSSIGFYRSCGNIKIGFLAFDIRWSEADVCFIFFRNWRSKNARFVCANKMAHYLNSILFQFKPIKTTVQGFL